MAYWLIKSEPATYSWDDLVRDGATGWDGVRNHQAANNMKAMRIGDRAFYYHSNEGRAIVGIVEITRTYHPDPTDSSGRFGMVEVRPLRPFVRPVTLSRIKSEPKLSDMVLVRQSRLSVQPVSEIAWHQICDLGGVEA